MRITVGAGLLVAVAATVVACGGSRHTTSPASSPVPPRTSAAPSTASSTPISTPTSAGPVVTGAGAYLVAPAKPVSIAASDDCKKLVVRTTQSVAACATATSPKGTITAVLVYESHDKYVDVYRREGTKAVLVLTGLVEGGTDGSEVRLGTIDPANDGYRKIVVVLGGSPSAAGTVDPPVDGYDLIDAPGVVSLHRTLQAGAVQLVGTSIRDFTTTANGVTASTLTYTGGAWHVSGQAAATLPAERDTLAAAST